MFTRHKFLLVTVKVWLKSVLNYRSYPKINLGICFLDHPVHVYNNLHFAVLGLSLNASKTT